MTNEDRRRMVATLTGVYGFYGADLTEFALGVWLDVAAEFDLAQFEAALNRHVRDPEAGRWLPKPADVIRKLRGDANDAALMAWSEVLRVARSGGNGLESLPQATLQALQDMGGIATVQRADESQNGFLQKRFTEAFAAHKRVADLPALERSETRALQ